LTGIAVWNDHYDFIYEVNMATLSIKNSWYHYKLSRKLAPVEEVNIFRYVIDQQDWNNATE